MEPIEFKEQTIVIAKDQPQYMPLPAHVHGDAEGRITFCWQLTEEEKQKILDTGKIWQTVLTFGGQLQPQLLLTDKPDMGD